LALLPPLLFALLLALLFVLLSTVLAERVLGLLSARRPGAGVVVPLASAMTCDRARRALLVASFARCGSILAVSDFATVAGSCLRIAASMSAPSAFRIRLRRARSNVLALSWAVRMVNAALSTAARTFENSSECRA